MSVGATDVRERFVARGRVLTLSRVVWDMVVVPGWLDDTTATVLRDWCRGHVDVFSVAEAMFPLVALACRRALGGPRTLTGNYSGSTYGCIALAARAPAPSCVAWISNHRGPPTGTTAATTAGQAHNRTLAIAVKEVAAALDGLCWEGHLRAARALLGDCGDEWHGTLPMLWDGRRVATWKAADGGGGVVVAGNGNGNGDEEKAAEVGGAAVVGGGGGGAGVLRRRVIEYVRASCGIPIFDLLCDSDSVEVARWLLSVLGIGTRDASWMLYESLSRFCGKQKIVRWLFDEFHLENTLGTAKLESLFRSCMISGCPANSRWFIEKKFPVPYYKEEPVRCLLRNAHASVEDCQYFEADIRSAGVDDNLLKDILNPDVAKWVLTTLSLDPSQGTLSYLCGHLGNVEFAEWLITEKEFAPTTELFLLACCTSSGSSSSSLAKWVSTRVTLTPSDITKGLKKALEKSNTDVAEWLDITFHVMDHINSKPGCVESILTELCSVYSSPLLNGLKWFIHHLPQPLSLKQSSVDDAIFHLIINNRSDAVIFLLETFPTCARQWNSSTIKLVMVRLMVDLKILQHFLQLVGEYTSAIPTAEFMGECLINTETWPSSKTVKWVIRKFDLQYSHINSNGNGLLFKLLSSGKNRCAQWLLDTFDIPLDDLVGTLTDHPGPHIDLAGWQMILRHYGDAINTTLIRTFLPGIALSPHVTLFMIHRFGITVDEIRELCSSKLPTITKICLYLHGKPLSFFE
ncbi:hypothetical protein Pelo_3206 [Pelomyxa schiedti]|nr:hypothetical protein Pelo_3206 [Pelomyxa schiedti]